MTSKSQNGSITRGQICPKMPFLKIFAELSAPRPILSFATTLYIKFDHIRQLFSKFRHFRKTFTKMRKFFEIWTPNTPKQSLYIAFFAHFFSKNGRITRTSVKIGRRSPPFWPSTSHPHSSFLIRGRCEI